MSLKAIQCTISAVVYLASGTAPLARGKIAGPLDHTKNLVIVEWDNGNLSKKDIRLLLDEETGQAENKRLLDEKDRLEREFENTRVQCGKKLAEAAKLINEASKMASKHGTNLQDLYGESQSLVSAMSAAGWNTSSWQC